MQASRRQQLERLLELSTRMLDNAQSDDWAAVMTLEMERLPLLTGFFAVAATPVEAASIAAALGQMQTLNAEVMALGVRTQQQVAAELCGLEAGRKVTRAYDLNR